MNDRANESKAYIDATFVINQCVNASACLSIVVYYSVISSLNL